jgi:dephospho-CoA kinase
MLRVGITGCIGSGKSVVTRIFAHLDVPVYDADSRARQLMTSSPVLVREIVALFGDAAYHASGELNRQQIASLAFANESILAKLNAIVHPVVINDFEAWCLSHTHAPYVIKEAALMFESDSYKQLDKVVVVTSPEVLRVQRAVLRDHSSEAAVRERMKGQMSQAEKLARADFEIRNGDGDLLIPQVLPLHRQFLHT